MAKTRAKALEPIVSTTLERIVLFSDSTKADEVNDCIVSIENTIDERIDDIIYEEGFDPGDQDELFAYGDNGGIYQEYELKIHVEFAPTKEYRLKTEPVLVPED